MTGEKRQVVRRLRERPSLVIGLVEGIILTELRHISQQVARLEQMILTRLYLTVEEQFNESELRNLCYRLEIAYENLGGNGKARWAQPLINYLHRRGRIEELVAVIQEVRPSE